MQPGAARAATYADLYRIPAHSIGQIVHGELHVQPHPAFSHAITCSILGAEIGSAYQRGRDGPGGWWILDKVEVHLGQHVLVPDLSGWRQQHSNTLISEDRIALPPDWICEILSPSTARIDRLRKLPIYAEFGVKHAWLIDPDQRSLEVFSLIDGHWRLDATYLDDAAVRAAPFEAVELALGDLWINPAPT